MTSESSLRGAKAAMVAMDLVALPFLFEGVTAYLHRDFATMAVAFVIAGGLIYAGLAWNEWIARHPVMSTSAFLAVLAVFALGTTVLNNRAEALDQRLRIEAGNSSPFLLATQYENVVHLAMATADGKAASVDAPHRLWMIVLASDMTIWNASTSQPVSLQFDFRTTVAGPVSTMEFADNFAGGFQTNLLQRSAVPITLHEDGPFRNQSRIAGVLPLGPDRWSYLRGPVDIKAGDHATGTLAFFYEQLDYTNCRVNLADGELIVTDKLSATSTSRFLRGGRWQSTSR